MAFNMLDYLRDGKVDFVYKITQYDSTWLIESIRKAPNRIEIINGFLPKLKGDLPLFCFDVIYDIPEFTDVAYELLNVKNITPEMMNNLLYNSPLGLKILFEYFDYFVSSDIDKTYFDYIVKYAFSTNNGMVIHILSRCADLHMRYLFMEYLINNHPDLIDVIYDDITKYTTSVTYEPFEQLTFFPKLMNPEDISKLAVLFLTNNRDEDYQKLKDFILTDYKFNYLASELLTKYSYKPDPYSDKKERIFIADADALFESSADYRYAMYLKHRSMISKQLLDDFAKRIRFYLESGKESELEFIYSAGLGPLLEKWTEQFMDLSDSKEYGFIGEGTTCTCFRIGDYVIKFVKTKWSYEDEICPNLFLIAKNYEEIYLRDKRGIVDGGLEVQKYLTRKADGIDSKYFKYFDAELNRLGYRRTDTLIKGTCGDNTMLLDTYLDADCLNPKGLPEWFKECPLVLIDRDRIYPKDNYYIKQLRNGY